MFWRNIPILLCETVSITMLSVAVQGFERTIGWVHLHPQLLLLLLLLVYHPAVGVPIEVGIVQAPSNLLLHRRTRKYAVRWMASSIRFPLAFAAIVLLMSNLFTVVASYAVADVDSCGHSRCRYIRVPERLLTVRAPSTIFVIAVTKHSSCSVLDERGPIQDTFGPALIAIRTGLAVW